MLRHSRSRTTWLRIREPTRGRLVPFVVVIPSRFLPVKYRNREKDVYEGYMSRYCTQMFANECRLCGREERVQRTHRHLSLCLVHCGVNEPGGCRPRVGSRVLGVARVIFLFLPGVPGVCICVLLEHSFSEVFIA